MREKPYYTPQKEGETPTQVLDRDNVIKEISEIQGSLIRDISRKKVILEFIPYQNTESISIRYLKSISYNFMVMIVTLK